MATKFVSLKYAEGASKPYTATFIRNGQTRKVRFSTPKKTFIGGKITVEKRDEWVAKRGVDYDYSDPTDINTLKRHLFYGRSHRLRKNYRKMCQLYGI